MKRLLVGVAFVLAGCASVTAPMNDTTSTVANTTIETTTTLAVTTTLPRGVMGSIFVSAMRNESMTYTDITWIDSMPDEAIVEWGLLVCDFLSDDTARGVVQTAEIALEALYEEESIFEADYELIYYGLGASIGAFCPEYEYKLSDL